MLGQGDDLGTAGKGGVERRDSRVRIERSRLERAPKHLRDVRPFAPEDEPGTLARLREGGGERGVGSGLLAGPVKDARQRGARASPGLARSQRLENAVERLPGDRRRARVAQHGCKHSHRADAIEGGHPLGVLQRPPALGHGHRRFSVPRGEQRACDMLVAPHPRGPIAIDAIELRPRLLGAIEQRQDRRRRQPGPGADEAGEPRTLRGRLQIGEGGKRLLELPARLVNRHLEREHVGEAPVRVPLLQSRDPLVQVRESGVEIPGRQLEVLGAKRGQASAHHFARARTLERELKGVIRALHAESREQRRMQERAEHCGRSGLRARIIGAAAGLGGGLELERCDLRIGERQPSGPQQSVGRPLAREPGDRGLTVLHGGVEVPVPDRDASRKQPQHGAFADSAGKAPEPPRDRLGRSPDERHALPRDRVSGGVEVSGRQPVLDRIRGLPARRQGDRRAPVQLGELGCLALLMQASTEELSLQRVQRVRVAELPREHPRRLDVRAKGLGKAERPLQLRVKLVDDACVEQLPPQLRLEPIEDLLRQVGEDRLAPAGRKPVGSGLRGRGQGDAERPPLGRRQQPLDLLAAGLAPAHEANAGGALRGREGEVARPQLQQAPGRPQLPQPQPQRPPRAYPNPKRVGAARQQHVEDLQRRGSLELLGVVDRDDDRLHKQQLQVPDEALRHPDDVDRLQRPRQPLRVILGDAGELRPDPMGQPRHQPTGIAVSRARPQPNRRPPPLLKRLLQRDRLPEPRVGDEDHRAAVETISQPPREIRALDPSLGGHVQRPRWALAATGRS